MARSTALRQEVQAMARIEQVLGDLPDDKTRNRVVQWVIDNYAAPAAEQEHQS